MEKLGISQEKCDDTIRKRQRVCKNKNNFFSDDKQTLYKKTLLTQKRKNRKKAIQYI